MRLFNAFFFDPTLGLWIVGGFMVADVILITVLFKRKHWM
jgi:hypothetical protein